MRRMAVLPALLLIILAADFAQAQIAPERPRFRELYVGNNNTNTITLSGNFDWAHYGRTDTNRFNQCNVPEFGPPNFISDRSVLAGLEQQSNGRFLMSWSDGTPTATATDSAGEVYVNGNNGNGFEFIALTPNQRRELRAYVGAFGSGSDANGVTVRIETQMQRLQSGVWGDVAGMLTSSEGLAVANLNSGRGGYYSVVFGPTGDNFRLRVRIKAVTGGNGQAPTSNVRLAAATITNLVPVGPCHFGPGLTIYMSQVACALAGGGYGGTAIEVPDWESAMPCGDALRGDMDGSGAVNNFDIDSFLKAVLDPDAYDAQFGEGRRILRYCRGDINKDGGMNNFDIDPFVSCIINLPAVGQPCP